MKPNFQKVFWIIHQEMFKPKLDTLWMDKKVEENLDYIRYQKVIPVYVKCVSDMYDGTTQFDITPVDVRDGKTKHWQWSRAVEDKEIGVTVFETEAEASAAFETKYPEDQRKVFAQKDQFRKMQS